MSNNYVPTMFPAPTEPGFYRYSGGRQHLMFLLTEDGQWFTIFDNGTSAKCNWGYIEQALGVFDLLPVVSEKPADENNVRAAFHKAGYLPDDVDSVLALFHNDGILFREMDRS